MGKERRVNRGFVFPVVDDIVDLRMAHGTFFVKYAAACGVDEQFAATGKDVEKPVADKVPCGVGAAGG